MSSRLCRRIGWSCLSLVLAAHSWAGETPSPVSPGEANQRSGVDRACPTFSWTEVEYAEHYELAVFARNDIESDAARDSAPGTGQHAVLLERIPGGATAWTPPAGRCLADGETYAWRVRAVGPSVDQSWSEPSWFRVEAGWSDEVLDRLLERLAARAQRDDLSGTDALERLQPARNDAARRVRVGDASGLDLAAEGRLPPIGTDGQASVHLKGGPPDTSIHAEHAGTYSVAILGEATSEIGNTRGIQGISDSDDGGIGMEGLSTTTSNDGIGVRGWVNSDRGYGVVGLQASYSVDDDPSGFRAGGFFGGDNGVIGYSASAGGYAVYGHQDDSSGSAWAGYFYSQSDGIYVNCPSGQSGLTVVGGTKSAAVPTEDGLRLLYSEESTEVWFSDYGFASTVGDRVVVEIDPVYAETVSLGEPYHVFLTAYGDAELYVSSRRPEAFEVRVRSGQGDVPFSYRLVARRRDFEGHRLERGGLDDGDSKDSSGADAKPASTPNTAGR